MLATLVAKVEHLSARVEHLLDVMPNPSKTWIPPRELAKLAGISTRTILNRQQAGVFRPESCRKNGRNWEYRRDLAMADLEKKR